MATDHDELTKGEVFAVLSSSRRRLLLYHLHERGGEAPLDELTREVAASEVGVAPDELDRESYKRLYISLYQTHVPALEDYGLVTYDSSEQHVSMTDRITDVVELIDVSDRQRRSRSRHYAVLGVVGAVTSGCYWLGIEPVAALPGPVVAGAVVALLVGPTLVHYYLARISWARRSALETLAHRNPSSVDR